LIGRTTFAKIRREALADAMSVAELVRSHEMAEVHAFAAQQQARSMSDVKKEFKFKTAAEEMMGIVLFAVELQTLPVTFRLVTRSHNVLADALTHIWEGEKQQQTKLQRHEEWFKKGMKEFVPNESARLAPSH